MRRWAYAIALLALGTPLLLWGLFVLGLMWAWVLIVLMEGTFSALDWIGGTL